MPKFTRSGFFGKYSFKKKKQQSEVLGKVWTGDAITLNFSRELGFIDCTMGFAETLDF